MKIYMIIWRSETLNTGGMEFITAKNAQFAKMAVKRYFADVSIKKVKIMGPAE